MDLGVLDVMQIFGRAGRPQFDKSGHGTIITTNDKLPHYLSLLTNQYPIESSFVNLLADNLNAEVSPRCCALNSHPVLVSAELAVCTVKLRVLND